jgi:hypothetical protein
VLDVLRLEQGCQSNASNAATLQSNAAEATITADDTAATSQRAPKTGTSASPQGTKQDTASSASTGKTQVESAPPTWRVGDEAMRKQLLSTMRWWLDGGMDRPVAEVQRER